MSEQLIQTPGTFGENGNFLLERELGRGGMGGVYMGRDKMLDRQVAVKVMLKEYGDDADFVGRFKKEAQACARLIHPNIAQVYSYGISDGMPYISMELVAGGSLWTLMRQNMGHTDVTRVLKICQQVAQALQCASDQGFVHGDIKPENILLDANGNAKIVDFGLAAMQKETDEIWGTPYYISPEKVKKEPIDFRADMYSLGGTLYHALTGVAPFEGTDAVEVIKKRFLGPPKKPSEIRSDLTPQIDALVMRLLELQPDKRYPSFEALIAEFKKVLTSGLDAAEGASEAEPASKPAATGAKKVTMRTGGRMAMRTRRMKTTTTMKKKPVAATSEDGEEAADTGAEEGEDVPPMPDSEDEDEEGGGSLVKKVVLSVVGGIVLIGGVIGFLVWYQFHDKAVREKEHAAQVASTVTKARDAIAETRKVAAKFADEFDEFAQKAVDAVQQPTLLLKGLLPDFADMMKVPPSKELLDAIAATNPAPAVVVEEQASVDVTNPGWKNLDDAHYIGGAKLSDTLLAGKAVIVLLWSSKDNASIELLARLQGVLDTHDTNYFAILASHGSKHGTKADAKKVLDAKKISVSVYEDSGAKLEPIGAAEKMPFAYIHDEKGALKYMGQDYNQICIVIEELITKLQLEANKKDSKKPAAPAAAAKPAASAAATNAPAKPASAAAAKPAEPAKPAKETPQVVNDIVDLWNRAYSCQASAVRIRHGVRKILALCDEADQFKDESDVGLNKLAEYSRTAKDMLDELKASKDVENVRKGITFIKSKGEKLVKQTQEKLRIEKLEADRKARAEKEKADEEARLKAAAEARQKAIDEEKQAIADKFQSENVQKLISLLEWKAAVAQLEKVKDGFKTPEGQLAANMQIRKIHDMELVQKILVLNMKGYVFKVSKKDGSSIRNYTVTSVDDKVIKTVAPDHKLIKNLTWRKFYQGYHGNLNEVINKYIVKGKGQYRSDEKSAKMGLKKWADAMLGAALTMQILCSDDASAAVRAEALVKEAIKQFEDTKRDAVEFFPDMKFEEAAAAEE